jgi:diguanylate cyclase (GGDEF)-like protein
MAISSERAQAPGTDVPRAPASPGEIDAPSAVDRRQHLRHALQVDATVGTAGGASRPCRIQDFCVGGLFLAIEGANGSGIVIGDKTLERDDALAVRFSAHVNGKPQEFEVSVLVARIIAGGVGVSFEGGNGRAIDALNHVLAASAQPAAPTAAPAGEADRIPDNVVDMADASRILATYQRRVLVFLESKLAALFEHAKDALYGAARDTTDQEKQSALFAAIQELDGLQEPMQATFLDSMSVSLRQPGVRGSGAEALVSESGNSDVTVIDTGTFDDWVIIKDIIFRALPKYDQRQQEIAARLSKFLNSTIDDESNPAGLTGIGFTFHDAIQNLGASHVLRQTIFHSFEETIVAGLGTLYDELSNILSSREVSAEVERTVANRPMAEKQETAKSDEPADSEVAFAEQEQASLPEQDFCKPASTLGLDPASITPPPIVVGNLLHTARSLLMLERHAKASDNLPAALTTMAGAQPVLSPAMGSRSLDQVIDALSILQRSPKFTAVDDNGPLALKERLMTTWRAAGVQLADGAGDSLEVISDLLDAILDDPLVTTRVKACVRRLAITLVKAALQDREFFSDEEHPARQLINQLGRVETAEDGSVIANGSWQMTIDPLVDRVVHGYERDTIVFEQALTEVEDIVARQVQHLSENVPRLEQARNRQQAQIDSRRDVGQDSRGAGSASGDDEIPTEWKRWLNCVEHLQAGDVVFLDTNDDRPEKLRLVWVSNERDSYLFASHCGDKTSTLTRQELAMHFRRGAARVLDASDLPVVDRGIYRMLNVLHARLAEKASRDGVTGMLNRKALESALGEAMAVAVRMDTNHVLCVLELDEFRAIVEKCGPKVGKDLLRKLARVLDKRVGSRGTIGRLTKGRFAMLLNNCDLETARAIADGQRKSMEKSRCVWQGESFQLTVSIGMVSLDGNSKATVADLIEAAGDAFEDAHAKGGNRIQAGSDCKSVHISTESVVVQMLTENRLQLRCQRLAPIGADTSDRTHFELLLGVKDASGALAMPRDFIQAAERNDEMHEVDMWVIRTALDWMSKHRTKVDAVGGYSINLSGLTLGDSNLLHFVLERLMESGVPPSKVIFEVTESAAINTLSVAVNFINTLKEYGCRFALDDFGTGDASFAYLRTLPIDFVKIDGSIVRDIVNSPKDLALVKSINEIAHFLGKKTVAEFVENDDILARLRQMGVDYAQGYGIEAPYVLT